MVLTKKPLLGNEEKKEPVRAACYFGKQRLLPLLEAFAKESDGVRAAEDIEYIHRMRVASRRLRAALPLFSSCFPEKNYTRWSEEIKKITRALGEARDTDVQIAYLLKYQKRTEKAWNLKKSVKEGEPPTSPAVRYLVLDLQKKRDHIQKEVISALDSLKKSHVIEDMYEAFSQLLYPVRAGLKRSLAYGISPVAAIRIEERLCTLLSFEPWVSHPEAVAEHHATRIAAKKLRYTLEVYAPVYRLGLKKPISRVKAVQEILGDLHDCDVWIDTITRLLLRERSFLRTENEEKRPDTFTLSSLKIFLAEKEKERQQIYRSFVRYWASLKRDDIWKSLRTTLDSGRKLSFRPHAVVTEEEIRTAVTVISNEFSGGQKHSLHVTMLSQMLFDSLKPFHKMDGRDRFLLECAGMLHDIGWRGGRKDHNKRSAAIIFSEERLLLDLAERGVIALAAFAHRGSAQIESQGFFQLLSPKYQKKTLKLTAILRIADGLDYLHLGTAQEIHCVIGKEIFCDVIASSDISQEKERARTKSDLFLRAFGRNLVIR
ncbi:MAG: CHAD domain-containing protein [Methanoregula sp.]|nr:CHAD domain-containing protein [Methanoregula sp.]